MARQTCRPDVAGTSCPERRMAVIRGRFRHRWGHGWVWLDSSHPDWTWDTCPWCGEGLPDLHEHAVAKVRDWMSNGWPSDVEPEGDG